MANQAMQRSNGGTGGTNLKAFLDRPDVRAKLGEVASAHMKADELVRLANMAASRQPELAKCSQASILRALMDAAALGIKPGGLMGRGYLVPRKNKTNGELEATFDPGWRGLIDVARRSGQVKRIEAHVVFEADHFKMMRAPFTSIEHVPSEDADPGAVRAAYAIAEFVDGSTQIEVLWRRDIDKIRKSSASANGPWATWYDEMARKSAVRRLCKYLPFDPILERALEAATDSDDDIGRDVVPTLEVDRPVQSKRLATKISSRKVDVAPAAPPQAAPQSAPLVDPMTGEVVEEEPEPDLEEPPEREPGEDG